jgi:hypothetical protein
MPQRAEDLAEDMTFRFVDEQDELLKFQRAIIQAAGRIQSMPKAFLNTGVVRTNRRMRQLNVDLRDYSRKKFSEIFLEGARSIDPTFRPTKQDNAIITRAALDQYTKLRGAVEHVPVEARRFMEMVRNDTGERRHDLGIKYNYVETHPELTIRKRGIKAISYKDGKKYTLGDYGSMMTRTNANRIYNLGAVQAAKQASAKGNPITHFVVSDGPSCGWSYHDDPDTADGKVVTIDDAARYPVAHPNCVRQFSPATKEQVKKQEDKDKRRAREQRQRLAKAAAIGITSVAGALEATNLLASSLEHIQKSEFFHTAIERMTVQALKGDLLAQKLIFNLNRLRDFFGKAGRPLAPVLRGVSEAGQAIGLQGPSDFPLNTKFKFFSNIYQGTVNTVKNLPEVWEDVRVYADGFMEGLGVKNIPGYIKKAVGAAEDATVLKMGDRFQAFYHVVKKAAMSEDVGENVARVISIEAKRRGAFERVLSNLPFGPEVRATWSKWGGRLRINVNDFVRGAITATPTGLIKSAAVNAAGQVRGVLKMYQDGTIGGHISVLPKRFLKGIVRGIVEVDENGALVGNLRLIPGGPLRLRLEFATGGERTDLRDFLISPLGALGDIGQRFRQFKFQRVVLDLKLFNRSVFDISANLRIPVEKIKDRVEELVQLGALRRDAATGKVTGLFTMFQEDPNYLRHIFRDVKSTVFGNIRFSSLTQETIDSSPFLRLLQKGNVRLLNRAHLTVEGLQDIATNLRLHGWNIYDIADILKLRWNQTKRLVINGMYRIKNLAEDMGVTTAEDLVPTWEKAVKGITKSYRSSSRFKETSPGFTINEADALRLTLETVEKGPSNVNPLQLRNLLKLANVEEGDVPAKIFNRLRNLRSFVKMNEGLDSKVLGDLTERLSDTHLRQAARDISRLKPRKLKVVRIAEKLPPEGPGGGGGLSSMATRIEQEAPGSRYARWHNESGHVNPFSFLKKGDTSLDDAEVFVTQADGTTRRIITPFVDIDVENWQDYIDDLLDANPHLFDDLFNEFNYMAQRYTKLPTPDIIFSDSYVNSPYYDMQRTIGIPFLDPQSVADGTPRLSDWWQNWGKMWEEASELRPLMNEVRGQLNPVFIHEYSHYVHIRMFSTEEGRKTAIEMIDNIGQYLGSREKLSEAFQRVGGRPDEIEELLFDIHSRFTIDGLSIDFDGPGRGIIEEDLGTYALSNMYELIAEANRHYLTDEHPGTLANIVGTALDRYYGIESLEAKPI